MNTGDLLAELLMAHGVEYVFGAIGGQGYPLNDALHRRRQKVQHIAVRDERSSAYAADGYARVSGKVGVCDAAFGVGVLKLPSGMAEAYNSSIPVLGILSNAPRNWMVWNERGCTAQGVEQVSPFTPITKGTFRVATQESLPDTVRYSFQLATAGRPGPVVFDIPADVFKEDWDESTVKVVSSPRAGRFPAWRAHPDPADVKAVASVLRGAERPVIVAGGGVAISQAWEALRSLAEQLQIPVATTIAGKGVFPDDHPLAIGVMGGQYGSEAANQVVAAADVVFLVGMKSSQQVTSAWTQPTETQTVVHLDVDPAEVGKVFPVAAGMVADARAGLEALAVACTDCQVERNAWLGQVNILKKQWHNVIGAEMNDTGPPIRPQHLMAQIQAQLNPEDIVVSDASFSVGWVGSYLRAMRGGQRFLFPRGLATMGFGVPAAIGARFAQQEGKVVVVVGDGSVTYALGELAVLAKYGLDIIVVVLNNSCLGYSKISEMLNYSADYEEVDFPDTDFALIARGFGCEGLAVRDPSELAPALETAFALGGPALLDVRVDPWQTPELDLRQRLAALQAE
ncbi:MAG: thiamine pyrophosphate-binding protein [Chloroflexota bacterium]|nr:thiamine pyrophosphate-binding protein [Chloroflexota bacterium]MDE2932094.1 thiamine pyrophosphate-binding protein [Chloroflexota bacterium]